jgi:acyl carrier protein
VPKTHTALSDLVRIFREVFDDPALVVTPRTTAADIEEWDSLMHVTLILNVEKAFSVKFTSSQVAALKSVGDLLALIEAQPARLSA